MTLPCHAIIDHANYPIDDIDHPKRLQVIEQVREQLAIEAVPWLETSSAARV